METIGTIRRQILEQEIENRKATQKLLRYLKILHYINMKEIE